MYSKVIQLYVMFSLLNTVIGQVALGQCWPLTYAVFHKTCVIQVLSSCTMEGAERTLVVSQSRHGKMVSEESLPGPGE